MPEEELIEWLKTQEGWTHLESGQAKVAFQGLSADDQQKTRVLFQGHLRRLGGEGLDLPTETTLQDGRTVPVRWEDTEDYPATFNPETEEEEPAIFFPILPVDAMTPQNVTSLMESVYGPGIWSRIPQQVAVNVASFFSLLEERQQLSGITREELLATPGLEADISTAALTFAQGQAPKVPGQITPPTLPEIPAPIQQPDRQLPWERLTPEERGAQLALGRKAGFDVFAPDLREKKLKGYTNVSIPEWEAIKATSERTGEAIPVGPTPVVLPESDKAAWAIERGRRRRTPKPKKTAAQLAQEQAFETLSQRAREASRRPQRIARL